MNKTDIDARVFNGDSLYTQESLDEFKGFVTRLSKEIDSIQGIINNRLNIPEKEVPLKYKDVNIVVMYICNKIGFGKFHELMKLTDEHFSDGYIDGKWIIFCQNSSTFVFTWEAFYNEVIKDIKKIGYKG